MRVAPTALAERYDLIVVGGGITGAGIFREAVQRGARALLLEGFVMGLWDGAKEPQAICEAAREALRRVV